MIIQHSSAVLLHRMAITQAKALSTTGALVAKFRADVVNRQTIDRLNAIDEPKADAPARLDKTA